MKNRRFYSNAFNKREMKIGDSRKNMKSKSKSTAKGSRIKNRGSNFNSRMNGMFAPSGRPPRTSNSPPSSKGDEPLKI
jgi:hypothetical protein